MCLLTIIHYEPCHCIRARKLEICPSFSSLSNRPPSPDFPLEQCPYYAVKRTVDFSSVSPASDRDRNRKEDRENRRECQEHKLPPSELERRKSGRGIGDEDEIFVRCLEFWSAGSEAFSNRKKGLGKWVGVEEKAGLRDLGDGGGVLEEEEYQMLLRMYREQWMRDSGIGVQIWAKRQVVKLVLGIYEDERAREVADGVSARRSGNEEEKGEGIVKGLFRKMSVRKGEMAVQSVGTAEEIIEGDKWRWNGKTWIALDNMKGAGRAY